jgi:hypothetical protein
MAGKLFNHAYFYYCQCDENIGLALLLFIPELFILLFILGDSTEKFLSPVLQQVLEICPNPKPKPKLNPKSNPYLDPNTLTLTLTPTLTLTLILTQP